MEAWQAAMTPGEHHAKLEPLVGTFDAASSFWMAEGAPPETSTATSVVKWILGNRYLEQGFSGTVMGGPFEGRGLTGYDNVQKKYVGTWCDSMGTGIMTSVGSVDAAGTTFTFDLVNWDPMTGKQAKAREVLVVEGPDKHVMTMFAPDPATGKEFKTMEIVFTRAAAK